MKILVCISKTPDTTAKISFSADQTQFNTDGIQYIMNPYDEWYALVKAIELKEKLGGQVTIIHVGPASGDVIIRKGLAIGADDAVRINTEPSGAFSVASHIATYAKDKSFDMIFCGKETIDYNGSEVAAMIAELLDYPFLSYGIDLQLEGKTATVTRDIEGGVEELEVECPIVVSAAKGMAEQRIPNMRGIMMAKRKPLEIVEVEVKEERSKVVSYALPQEKTGVKMVDPEDMNELVRLLHEEAKVI